MAVTGIGGGTQWLGVGQAGAVSWPSRVDQALAPVAQLFGESPQQLATDLRSGLTSMSALAQTKGISQSDLLKAIEQSLQQASANGAPQLSAAQLTNLAGVIANRVHGGHHHHGGHGVGAAGPTPTTGTLDPDGDGDGGASPVGGTGTLKTDVEQLIADLQATQGSDATAGAAGASPASSLLSQLTQFDQSL